MKRDLRNLGGGGKTQEPQPRQQEAPQYDTAAAQEAYKGFSENDMNTIQSAVEHYSGKSDAELMNELSDFRKSGAIDDSKLADVAARLSPMLNAQQRARLESVLGTLKKT